MFDFPLVLGSFLVAIVVGLTGMGGGALMTPMMMLFFNVPPLAAISSDLVASAVMKPIGGLVHLRRGTVDLPLVGWLCVGSVPAAFCGVFLAREFAMQDTVKYALGVALLLAVAGLALKAWMGSRNPPGPANPTPDGAPAADGGVTASSGVSGGATVSGDMSGYVAARGTPGGGAAADGVTASGGLTGGGLHGGVPARGTPEGGATAGGVTADGVPRGVAASRVTAGGGVTGRVAARGASGGGAAGGVWRGGESVVVRPIPTVLIGMVGGVVVGVSSVGSGSLIIVALLVLYPALKVNRLVGTDLVQAVPLVMAAAIGHLLFGDFQLDLTLSLLAGAIPGVYLGARISSRAPGGPIRAVLAVVLLASALKLLDVNNVTTLWILSGAVLAGTASWWFHRRRRQTRTQPPTPVTPRHSNH